jgi:topoisomerase-4 subunit A
MDKNQEEIAHLQKSLQEVEKNLKNVKKFTIDYLKNLIQKYSKEYPRKTRIKSIEEIDRRAIETKKIKVGYDPKTGFVGTKISGPEHFTCTNFDKLLVLFKDGTYKVTAIPEKQYLENAVFVGVADKKTIINVIYTKEKQGWAKRFIVDKFILDKTYRYLDENTELHYISSEIEPTVEIQFVPKAHQKKSKIAYSFKDALVKGASTRGTRVATQPVKRVNKLLV